MSTNTPSVQISSIENKNDTIICWKRPRKQIGELDCFESLASSTLQIISPKNVISSSISAITFDDAGFMSSSSFVSGKTMNNNTTGHDGEDQDVVLVRSSEGLHRQFEEKHCSKGSLFYRISNHGYQNDEESNYEKVENDNTTRKNIMISKPEMVVDEADESPLFCEEFDSKNNGNERFDEQVGNVCIAVGKGEETNILNHLMEDVLQPDDQKEDFRTTQASATELIHDMKNFCNGNWQTNCRINGCKESSSSNSSSKRSSQRGDEWREVKDGRTGTSYFYNRRTRESRWHLPRNAILLPKSRTINDHKKRNISNPREVSMSTSEMSHTECSVEKYSPENHIHHRIDHNDDATSCTDTLEEDYQSEEMLIERWKKLKKPLKIGHRRRFFFPENVDNNDDEEIDQMMPTKVDKSSSVNPDNLYCMFCGVKFPFASLMISHIRGSDCQTVLASDQVHDLCGVIERTFRLTTPCRKDGVVDDEHDDEHDDDEHNKPSFTARTRTPQEYEKEKVSTPNNRPTLEETTQELTEDSYSEIIEESIIFTNSDEEDTVADFHLSRSFQYKEPSLIKALIEDDNTVFVDDIESSVISRCPFCSKAFRNGSNLSKHLLTCNERQRSNRKRMKSINCVKKNTN